MRAGLLAALGLVGGFGLACALGEDSTLDQECRNSEHCVFGQECVVTGYQASLAEGTGWCRPKGDGCKTGEQPGCECEIEGDQGVCLATGLTAVTREDPDVPSTDAMDCVCIEMMAGTGG